MKKYLLILLLGGFSLTQTSVQDSDRYARAKRYKVVKESQLKRLKELNERLLSFRDNEPTLENVKEVDNMWSEIIRKMGNELIEIWPDGTGGPEYFYPELFDPESIKESGKQFEYLHHGLIKYYSVYKDAIKRLRDEDKRKIPTSDRN